MAPLKDEPADVTDVTAKPAGTGGEIHPRCASA